MQLSQKFYFCVVNAATTIKGRQLFKGGNYLLKYSVLILITRSSQKLYNPFDTNVGIYSGMWMLETIKS